MDLTHTSTCSLSAVNPLIVSYRPIRKLEQFCKSRKLAFEVASGTLAQASRQVRDTVARGKHSSVMLVGLPTYKWKMVPNGHIPSDTGTSDLPYMFTDNGLLDTPVCRLPENPQHAIAHIGRIFNPGAAEDAQKVTILFGVPKDADPKLVRLATHGLQRHPERAFIAIYYYLRRLCYLKNKDAKGLIFSEEDTFESYSNRYEKMFEDALWKDPSLYSGLYLGTIGKLISELQSRGISVMALPAIKNPQNEGGTPAAAELEHFASSSVIVTLGIASPVHGDGKSLCTEKGENILAYDQIRMTKFRGYPFFWMEGCHSASPKMTAAILRAGGAGVGNSTYSYSQKLRLKSDNNYSSPDLDIIFALMESQTYGQAHIRMLQGYLADVNAAFPASDSVSFVERIIGLESLELKLPEAGHKEAIRLLNRSQFWGNCEMTSRLRPSCNSHS